MGQFTPLRTFLAVKDSFDKHSAPTDAHIIIGTPGTVLDMIVKRKLDVKNIKAFVLDEADNMLDQQSLGEQTLRVKKLVRLSRYRKPGDVPADPIERPQHAAQDDAAHPLLGDVP